MSNEKTIAALKTNFLRQQIRILSQPLKLSDKAKAKADLPDDDIRSIMLRANQILRRHSNSVYDRVAVSNVATQIEQLFWYSSEPDDLLAGEVGEDDGIIRVGDDLAESKHIHKLATFVDEDDEKPDFTTALERLQELDDKRTAALRKLAQYKQLQALLERLTDPQENIQPDLVTRDGPLADELSKTKALEIRVAGGIARRNDRTTNEDGVVDEDVIMIDEGKKLDAILNST